MIEVFKKFLDDQTMHFLLKFLTGVQNSQSQEGVISNFIPFSFQAFNSADVNGILLGYHVNLQCMQNIRTRNCREAFSRTVKIAHTSKSDIKVGSLTSWTKFNVRISVYNKIGAGPYSNPLGTTTSEESKYFSSVGQL